MPRVLTYCRVSSEEQALKDLSIPAQKKALARWLEQNPDHTPVGDFVDEGLSAFAPANKRTGFCDMIARCKARDVDVILVHKLDRFSRNQEESVLFKSMLRRHSVTVRSITENYDPDTPHGFLMEGIAEVMNQFFSMNLANEVRKGLRENAERGNWNGPYAPLGYRIERVKVDGGRDRRTLALGPPDEIALVRTIFELSTRHGLGAVSIAKVLNGQGLPSARGGVWCGGSVAMVLKNPAYAGDLVWNRVRTMRDGTHKRTEPKDQVRVSDAFPAIISRELFEQQQATARARDFRENHQRTRPVKHLLSRLITCAHCGSRFYGERRDTRRGGERIHYGIYRCGGHSTKGETFCKGVTLRGDWLEGRVIAEIREAVGSEQGRARLSAIVTARIEGARKSVGKDSRALQAEISRLDARVEHYYRAIGDGMELDACRRFIDEAHQRKEALQREAEDLQREDRLAEAQQKNAALLSSFAVAFEQGFERLPFGAKRQIVLQLIERIEVIEHETVRIYLRVPFDTHGLQVLTNPESAAATEEGRDLQLVPRKGIGVGVGSRACQVGMIFFFKKISF